MNNRRTLSIAPYYGGKGKMAHFIADRLDYANSDIFVTPFGGMCRVLLNKPRHKVECYNDYSSALCALMTVLADPKKADELIHRLYDKTEYSEECFSRHKEIYDYVENDIEKQEREEIRKILIDEKIVSSVVAGKLLELIGQYTSDFSAPDFNEDEFKPVKQPRKIEVGIERLKEFISTNKDFKNKYMNWIRLCKSRGEQNYLPRSLDMEDMATVSEMDLAMATYVVFSQSRDGMGKAWAKGKFIDPEQYKKRILRLYDCAERLEDISVYQIDAMDFFRRWEQGKDLDSLYHVMNEWISNPDVMMYCDPSYISVKSEEILLREIDVDNVDSLSDAIKEKYKGKKEPENLGKIYSMSFRYDEQEKFLRCIQNARCRILVSNYDLKLYNKYLNESTGWRREEFETITSVGNKFDNTRTEVIWYNY